MRWHNVQKAVDVDRLTDGVVFFKHSETCGVSAAALRTFEAAWDNDAPLGIAPYLVSVQDTRDVSNYLAQKYGVQHESPQLLLIQDGQCTLHASHENIQYATLKAKVMR